MNNVHCIHPFEEKLPPKVEEEQNKVGVKEKEVGGNELLSHVQELQDELKRSEQERIELTDGNTALQSELDASKQEITSLKERLLSRQRKQVRKISYLRRYIYQ